ncbi:hypothetical protein [Salininema proteolyticum]|uniref:Uncharacterized protein n=1 Tax=Salininema proteolyticum TaxID=1607685 RepID=A0ABV8TXQ1_9ACTN
MGIVDPYNGDRVLAALDLEYGGSFHVVVPDGESRDRAVIVLVAPPPTSVVGIVDGLDSSALLTFLDPMPVSDADRRRLLADTLHAWRTQRPQRL